MSIFDSIKGLFGGSSASNGDEMIPCEDALRLVHDFLDGELGDVPAEQVRRHFEVCGRCYPHLQLENAYRDAVRRAAAGQGAPEALKARVAALLAEAGAED